MLAWMSLRDFSNAYVSMIGGCFPTLHQALDCQTNHSLPTRRIRPPVQEDEDLLGVLQVPPQGVREVARRGGSW